MRRWAVGLLALLAGAWRLWRQLRGHDVDEDGGGLGCPHDRIGGGGR